MEGEGKSWRGTFVGTCATAWLGKGWDVAERLEGEEKGKRGTETAEAGRSWTREARMGRDGMGWNGVG